MEARGRPEPEASLSDQEDEELLRVPVPVFRPVPAPVPQESVDRKPGPRPRRVQQQEEDEEDSNVQCLGSERGEPEPGLLAQMVVDGYRLREDDLVWAPLEGGIYLPAYRLDPLTYVYEAGSKEWPSHHGQCSPLSCAPMTARQRMLPARVLSGPGRACGTLRR